MVNQLAKGLLITKVTELIAEKYKMSISQARDLLYDSELMDLIDDENTGLYGESPQYIFYLFEQENIQLSKLEF